MKMLELSPETNCITNNKNGERSSNTFGCSSFCFNKQTCRYDTYNVSHHQANVQIRWERIQARSIYTGILGMLPIQWEIQQQPGIHKTQDTGDTIWIHLDILLQPRRTWPLRLDGIFHDFSITRGHLTAKEDMSCVKVLESWVSCLHA